MSTTNLTESDLLDDKTTPSAIGAETGDGGSQTPATEKRNRGDESEEQKPCSCEGDGEENDYVKEYFKRVSAIHGREIVEGGRGARDEDEDDSGDEGHLGDMLDDPEIAKIWCAPHPVMCCSYPFTDLEFKQDTKLYDGLKVFGGKAVDYLNATYNYGAARFQDIVEVTSCNASCKHRIVTLKAIDGSDRVWEIVLRGRLPPEDDVFAEANPSEFYLLQYSY